MDRQIAKLRTHISKMQGKAEHIQAEIKRTEKYAKAQRKRYVQLEAAQVIIQNVAQTTQEKLSYHVSELVTLALQSTFPDPYDFKVEFVLKRGKTEADMYFMRRDMKADPLTASGGGAVDVASFALRASLWSLQRDKTRPLLILDEPFRFVSANLQDKASALLKEISNRMGIQFIIVTHEDQLMEYADRTFKMRIKKGISAVQLLESKDL